ncbi:type II CAAX endopeptidase family protein [Desertibacillus haloalkaliphilus]|uniref:type II CAAX endopeptidase family protein n=1 Tax=Desertibacillus haloalkaliphilus TaxID=1328930 RepID=UPI001C254321|nr:type II CAAX endopeptidase family protein [Desertibacillus haloalkaliphilus]MBU8907782.1 CPBP family intramembrane metalloprotease [Desertibacillus haloalkaliphilus]
MYIRVSFIIAIFLAHVLLWLSFTIRPFEFWVLFPLSLLVLSLYALTNETMETRANHWEMIWIGTMTGIGLYSLYALGKWLIVVTDVPLLDQLEALYAMIQPIEWWHYLLLFTIVIPGEELFWRGFVLKRLIRHGVKPIYAVIGASLLYASANIYAGSLLLLVATVLAGLLWSTLYLWKRNIWLCIFSHLIFDLFLLVLFPLL